jgi:hypothetical protein
VDATVWKALLHKVIERLAEMVWTGPEILSCERSGGIPRDANYFNHMRDVT